MKGRCQAKIAVIEFKDGEMGSMLEQLSGHKNNVKSRERKQKVIYMLLSTTTILPSQSHWQ